MGHSEKDPYPTHRGNFCGPEVGEGNCLRSILNLYRMFVVHHLFTKKGSLVGTKSLVHFFKGGGL